MRMTTRVRSRIRKDHIKKRVKEGTRKSLPGAGVIVQRSARKQFSNRSVKTKPVWSRVGEDRGVPVLAMEFRPPKSGKITSWKNPRGRGATRTGFLRTLIRWDVDNRSNSVVIGPTNEATWLNRLQELGGSGQRVLKLIGRYPGKNRILNKFPPPAKLTSGGKRRGKRASRGRAIVGVWVDPAHTRRRGVSLATATGRVPPARYMKKGLDAKRAVLAEQWRNRITGP